MKRNSLVIALLAIALLGTNAFWAFNSLDQGISNTYLDASYQTAQEAAASALAALPVAARAGATPQDVVAAVVAASAGAAEPFEKDGYTWVGGIGLKFDAEGRLVDARSSGELP